MRDREGFASGHREPAGPSPRTHPRAPVTALSRRPAPARGWLRIAVGSGAPRGRVVPYPSTGAGTPGCACPRTDAPVARDQIAHRRHARAGDGQPGDADPPTHARVPRNPVARARDLLTRSATPDHACQPTRAQVSDQPRPGAGSLRIRSAVLGRACHRPIARCPSTRIRTVAHPAACTQHLLSPSQRRTRPWNAPNASPCCTAC